MAQLKMYWLPDTPLEEPVLPDGYSYAHFVPGTDNHAWCECLRGGHLIDGRSDERAYHDEIENYHDIEPENDIWFLDYKGEHIGTATAFVHKAENVGDMHQVGIRSDFRGKGLAKYLSYIVLKSLKDRNVKYVSLTTGEGRIPAVKSYLSAGFLPVEYDVNMQNRWQWVLKNIGMNQVEMLYNDATPFKTLYAEYTPKKANVREYGAVGDGIHDDADAFNRAFAENEEIYISEGEYIIGSTLHIPSFTHIFASPSAHIRLADGAQKGRYDFLLDNADRENGNKDILIEGGIWDGNCANNDRGDDLFDTSATTGVLFNFRNVKGLHLHNLSLKNPLCYYMRFCEASLVKIENIGFVSDCIIANQDGIHFAGFCRDFVIRNLWGRYGSPNDDFLAFNADDALHRQESFDVINGPIENIVVENVYSEKCHCFVRLLSVDSPIRNITVRNISGLVKGTVICMDAARRCRVPLFRNEDRPNGVGRIENVVIENLTVRQDEDKVSPMISMETNCRSLTVRNWHTTEVYDSLFTRICNVRPHTVTLCADGRATENTVTNHSEIHAQDIALFSIKSEE